MSARALRRHAALLTALSTEGRRVRLLAETTALRVFHTARAQENRARAHGPRTPSIRFVGWGSPMKCYFITVLVVLSAAFQGCGPVAPDIVLVVMDTVRPDHLSCYGYERDTSPNLSALAESSAVWTNAYSTSCWTAPAHASMFTGLYPVAHRCTQENPDLQPALVSLAEILSDHGYVTIGITENGVLHRESNFSQGFDEYYETWVENTVGSDEETTLGLFSEALGRRVGKQPMFIFINLIAAHVPYEPPQRFLTRLDSGSRQPRCSGEVWKDLLLGRVSLSHEEVACIEAHYDAEIMFVDHVVGRMVGELKSRGRWENTVFVATSDHGENLGD
ncbi:sulfatase, partial [Candidatus Fermentibacteria bacterium]|nr:sulfatase [Candidatus Fermentibacteria bacterium]